MQNKKKELGKGIRALLSSMETEGEQERVSISRELSKTITEIPIDWIEPNPHQPRTDFDHEAIELLSQSIKTHGIIQPLTLRRLSDEAFQIVAGERRFRAAKKAGLESVPAYIRIADDQLLLEMALVENIQREDLNALEIAISMNRLINECDLTHEELSGRLGKNRSTVTNYLRLLKLPPEIQRAVRNKKLSMGHARALAGIDDVISQLAMYRKTIDEELSVRALEQAIKRRSVGSSGSSSGGGATELPVEVRRVRDELASLVGAKVDIKRKASGSGSFVIHFSNDDEFNRIVDAIQGE